MTLDCCWYAYDNTSSEHTAYQASNKFADHCGNQNNNFLFRSPPLIYPLFLRRTSLHVLEMFSCADRSPIPELTDWAGTLPPIFTSAGRRERRCVPIA